MKRNNGQSTLKMHALVLILCCLISSVAQGQKITGTEKTSSVLHVLATIETSIGSFEIELYQNDAPKTVDNFVRLAEKNFFDGTRVHRVSRFEGLIQMGDDKSKDTTKMKEWGNGGRSIWGKEFQDELDPRTLSYKEGYKRGVVAMANRGPNANSSLFFILIRDAPYMPKNYTIFGKVVRGIDVIDRIAKVEIVPLLGPEDGRPKQHVLVKKVTILNDSASKPQGKGKK